MISPPKDAQSHNRLITHLRELRKRLITSVAAYFLAAVICSFFSRELYALLSWPLQKIMPSGSHFITTHPVEAWIVYLKTALIAAFFLASPVFFFQAWRFMSPGLVQTERKKAALFSACSALLFVGGACFGYFVMFPVGFTYFVSLLEGTDILFLPRMEDYLSLSFQLLLAFGIIFELPLVVVFLAATGLVHTKQLIAFRKYNVLLSFVLAAVLTPPDAVSQISMALPMLLLYELGLIGAQLGEKTHGH